jgi:hypothetical protein
MSEPLRSRMDELLDLLADELAARLQRRYPSQPEPTPPPAKPSALAQRLASAPAAVAPPTAAPETEAAPAGEDTVLAQEAEPEPEAAPSAGPSHGARLMARLALGLLVGAVLINVPLNRYGTTLATALPQSESLAIRNGLVVKEEDDPEIYVYQDGAFRWISSLEAFEHFGYTWDDVHVVRDGWLAPFEIGAPIYVLLKCPESPHIYRLEAGTKRWIVDIDTFTAEGHVWEDVKFVSCDYLRALPDGETIPPGHGPPPQP